MGNGITIEKINCDGKGVLKPITIRRSECLCGVGFCHKLSEVSPMYGLLIAGSLKVCFTCCALYCALHVLASASPFMRASCAICRALKCSWLRCASCALTSALPTKALCFICSMCLVLSFVLYARCLSNLAHDSCPAWRADDGGPKPMKCCLSAPAVALMTVDESHYTLMTSSSGTSPVASSALMRDYMGQLLLRRLRRG